MSGAFNPVSWSILVLWAMLPDLRVHACKYCLAGRHKGILSREAFDPGLLEAFSPGRVHIIRGHVVRRYYVGKN